MNKKRTILNFILVLTAQFIQFDFGFAVSVEPSLNRTLQTLNFLDNLFSRSANEKPLVFLTKEETDAHKPKKQFIPLLSKSIEFLDLGSSTRKEPKPTTNSIHFLDPKSSLLENGRNIVSSRSSNNLKPKVQEFHELQKVVNPHPFLSPRNGTDISSQHQMAVLLCPNQSKCIVPQLQLKKKLKVYLCRHPARQGVRFYYLAREGLLLHPNVEMLNEEAIHQADYIVYLPGSAPWHLTECTNSSFASKLLVLDEYDGHSLISPTVSPDEYIARYGGRSKPWYFMYFKRSFVRRTDGLFQGYPHLHHKDVYPMTYAIAEAYLPSHFNFKREIEILCTLRGSKHMTTRLRAQTWVAEYGIARNINNIVTEQVNTHQRTKISLQYFQQMFNAQIIVTVNPANWEGDFRLWEALCTGALVFVDALYVPHPYPLQDGIHVIYFDNNNKTDLYDKLDYYRSNRVAARRIAIAGYLHAMKYHRTVSLIDYVLRSAATKQVITSTTIIKNETARTTTLNYDFTAQYLNEESRKQEKAILACRSPGIYLSLEEQQQQQQQLEYQQGKYSSNITRVGIDSYDKHHHYACILSHRKRESSATSGALERKNIHFSD